MQYYSDWLLRRFTEGYVLVRNPRYPHLVTRYDLTPDKVDCVVFCSKDYRPILSRLHEVTDRFPAYSNVSKASFRHILPTLSVGMSIFTTSGTNASMPRQPSLHVAR